MTVKLVQADSFGGDAPVSPIVFSGAKVTGDLPDVCQRFNALNRVTCGGDCPLSKHARRAQFEFLAQPVVRQRIGRCSAKRLIDPGLKPAAIARGHDNNACEMVRRVELAIVVGSHLHARQQLCDTRIAERIAFEVLKCYESVDQCA